MSTNSAASSPIVMEIVLNGPVEKVWKALTNKEEMKKWYFDIAEFTPEIGYTFNFFGEKDGKKFKHICTILELEVDKKLSYTWTYEGVEGETIVHFELFPQGSQTRLRLVHEGLENLPQNEDYARSNFQEGWNYIIGTSIKNYMENK